MNSISLAISLLRLGDLLMHGHVLKALSKEKNSQISLLTHPFYDSISFLFPFIDKVYLLERESCQHSLGEPNLNKIWPLHHIEALLEKINSVSYQTAIDLTHTEHSFRWLTFIDAKEKVGVCYDKLLKHKSLIAPNPYLTYLHSTPQSQYHFIDLFKQALKLPLEPLPKATLRSPHKPKIILQTLTSDPKKNWPMTNWKKLIPLILDFVPNSEIQILTSKAEHPKVDAAFGDLSWSGLCDILCTTLQETYTLLKSASVLISLDTAIKHLATWSETPIIELAIGSSNPFETGAYQEDAIILCPQVSCAPCRHSSACSQKEFLCHSEITPELVLKSLLNLLLAHNPKCSNSKMFYPTDQFHQEHLESLNANVNIYKVKQNKSGWFMLTKPNLSPIEDQNNARRDQKPFEACY